MEHKLGDTAYILVYWKQVKEVVIMKVKITGMMMVDDTNIMYLCDNSRYHDWHYDTKIYSSIDEALENLKERIVE